MNIETPGRESLYRNFLGDFVGEVAGGEVIGAVGFKLGLHVDTNLFTIRTAGVKKTASGKLNG